MINNPIFDVAVEGGKITPLSPSFARLGGQPHSKGGTDLQVLQSGEIIEAQKNEPISKQEDGRLVAWGKMKNPHTGNTFERDANILATLENRVQKIAEKGQELTSEVGTTPAQALSFTTGKVLLDAATVKDTDLTLKKEIYARTQQEILNVSEVTGTDPKQLSNKIAKNGATMNDPLKVRVKITKKADGGDLTQFKQYTPELQDVIQQNQNQLVTDIVQPRPNVYGQTQAGNTYGQAYNEPLNAFNQIRQTWGLQPYDVSTPAGVKQYQTDYNNAFQQRTGQSFYQGQNDPLGIDSKYGNLTSSQIPFRDNFKGSQNKTLTAAQIQTMSDADFKAISGLSKAEFLKQNPNIGNTWEYNFSTMSLPTYSADADPVAYERSLNLDAGNPTPLTMEAPVRLGNNTPTQQTSTQPLRTQNVDRPSLADRNRLGLTQILPEISAILDQPDYVPRQEYRPQYSQAYQVSFQDKLNQNQASFNQAQAALADNPSALATLAAQKRQADSQVLAEEFRTNQAIEASIADQNQQLFNQATLQNLQLADQQFVRQEQAKANTEAARQAALRSLSAKTTQRQAENNAIRLLENFSNFRVDPNMRVQNYNAPATFYDAQGRPIQVSQEDYNRFVQEQRQKNNAKAKFGRYI